MTLLAAGKGDALLMKVHHMQAALKHHESDLKDAEERARQVSELDR